MCIRDRCKAVFFDFGDTIAFNNAPFPQGLWRLLRDLGMETDFSLLSAQILRQDDSMATPVSYTHLDVYKRQGVLESVVTMQYEVVAARSFANSITDCIENQLGWHLSGIPVANYGIVIKILDHRQI